CRAHALQAQNSVLSISEGRYRNAGCPSDQSSLTRPSQSEIDLGRVRSVVRVGGYGIASPHRSGTSPCLTSVVVSPCGTRAEFCVSHYIVVGGSSGGVGGRRSVIFSALRTCRARGLPGVTPVRG